MLNLQPLLDQFQATTSQFRDNVRVVVAADKAHALLTTLKEQHGFDMLVDITAVDYLEYEGATDRFGVVYCVLSTETGERLVVKTHVNEPNPTLPTATNLWRGADWMEREVFDMFGITFAGHPDLRRILMPEEFTSYPLRKDYPLKGRGERHNFPVITRSES
ncbi:NADH-quinone oxidoreductase subunit C [Planctomyces sp. SH-PL14]|uniref:NADH-quinone oxidoreductase subunit C n=1 Tax=Planctomyces sp. SH-PL14 TaxID=1632864 RepID=UPI00078E7295|nr:NADH-quinone oxidoreductase subunit C [Planctomyces sp. SH-PL14]AMV21126.1 NADH-quinone oxidoreductase subunit 5 [Planctomyces sp. SH-PL14]